MKILLSQKIDGIAGSENYLLRLSRGLISNNVEVHFLILYKEQNGIASFQKELEKNDIPFFCLSVKGLSSLTSFRKIRYLITENEYDIVHTNLIFTDFYFAIFKRFFLPKLKLVSGKHGYEEKYTNKYGFRPVSLSMDKYLSIAKLAETQVNRSYAISRGLFNLFTGLGISRKEQIEVVNYGFDFNSEYAIRKECTYGKPQLVIVGRLTHYKGHRFAFKAIQLLKDKYPEIKLVIVGSGELDKHLKSLAVNLGIKEQVVFTGFRKNARDFMASSDIVLVPSVSEGFGITILEALSVKKPIVAFDVPSPNELLEHKESCILVPPYDEKLYAEAIDQLLMDKELKVKIEDNGYRLLKMKYNLQTMIDKTIAFYSKVLDA